MNLMRLEYFVTLAHIGNVQRASEMLRISPPALSKAMKVLEQEFATTLWMRDGRRIVLTDNGRRLLKKAPQLIENFRILKKSLSDGEERPIKIGTFEVFSTYFLSCLEKIGWKEQPLELHELLPGEIEKYIGLGELDLGITYIPVPDPKLDFLRVTAIEMGVYARKGAFADVPQKDLPFVVPATPLQGVATRAKGLDGWPDDAYERKVMHRVTLMESGLELCRQGLVAGYFPAFVVREHNLRFRPELQLERRPSPYSGRVCRAEVFIVKRKSYEETTAAKKLSKAIRMVCSSTDSLSTPV